MAGFKRRNPKAPGSQAERHAEAYLIDAGLELIGRNYQCRFGEIDLVMRHHDRIVFVEVRARASERFGGALASIEHTKQAKLIRTASYYLAYETQHSNISCRFDVVAVSTAHFGIRWIKNAFDLTG